jgi:Helix-turn-helix of DDE superfamily endonuclease/DDE superfamily endonuclease
MNYSEIQKKDKQFLALTSLKVEEFTYLMYHFRPQWDQYAKYYKLDGSRRKIVSYQEHGNAVLKGTETKLFFLLVYLKNNSLQEHEAASFGISQSKVSQRLYNRMISVERVVIEHVNSGIKRLRMLKETIRVHNSDFRDMVMAVGCALHNLRVVSPYRDY